MRPLGPIGFEPSAFQGTLGALSQHNFAPNPAQPPGFNAIAIWRLGSEGGPGRGIDAKEGRAENAI